MKKIVHAVHQYLDKLSLPGNGRNRLQRYGLVIVLVVMYLLIKSVLITALGKDVPFLFSLFIVIICAWYGGLGPGILATLLTGGITYFFYLEPKYTIFGEENVPNAFILLAFFLEGFFISMLSESHRRNDMQRSEFLGVVSHELKNPLTSIKGYAEMIRRGANKKGEKKLADFAERIDMQTKQVIAMINEMLDITKIETGRLTYQDETFDIVQLVKEIISDQQVTTDSHKILLVAKGSKMIYGDKYRIGQVIINIITNAIKYSPNATKVHAIVASKRSGVVISVKDFGSGINTDDQAKLFEPFFRARNAKSAKGTGIGLFISSQIVQRHNGRIWVKSTIGKGSTFYVQLPSK